MKFTYRCDDPRMAERIKALRSITGWSFQQITHNFYLEWLRLLNQHGDLYRDLPVQKQINRASDELSGYPAFENLKSDLAWHDLNDRLSEEAMKPIPKPEPTQELPRIYVAKRVSRNAEIGSRKIQSRFR